MESEGAAKPGILVLTTGLSKPFRRLDKYSAILQELERHMELNHPDRGDTQRSIAVYKDLAATCIATRRQKELELQILTGPVRGWQGQELSSLGEILHMGSVAVGSDHRDRYFVLFPQTLLILSVSQRMSAFKYEGKLPLSGILVNRLQDSESIKNAFEISGPLIERIMVVCQGPVEANKWVELLTGNLSDSAKRKTGMELKRNISAGSMAGNGTPPPPPPHSLDNRGYSLCAFNIQSTLSNDRVTYPPVSYPSTAPYAQLTSYFRELVKDGTLTRFIVKALLYPEFLREFDISEIKMRRKHKSKKKLKRHLRKESWFVSESSSEEGEEEEDEDPEGSKIFRYSSESTVEECSECHGELEEGEEDSKDEISEALDDSTYGLIEYYTGKKSINSAELTDYESFVDHGTEALDVTDEFFISAPFCDTPTDNTNLVETIDDRESLMIGSSTTKLLDKPTRTSQSPVHTSTARLNLAAIKQQESQMSSFEHQLGGHMACEDLVNVDEEMQIKNCLKTKPILETRHSMPMYFVGNRFNTSSKTEIYIPNWKEKQESRERSKDTSKKDSILANNDNTRHSKFESQNQEDERDDVCSPPDMFRNDSIRPLVLNLSREATPFKKHSINSDKRMSNHSIHRKSSSQLMEENQDHRTSINYTPRSSDSGMAGSCTISSPDAQMLHEDLISSKLVEMTLNPEKFILIKESKNKNNDSGQYESDVKNLQLKSKSNETLITTDALLNHTPSLLPVISTAESNNNYIMHENTNNDTQRHTTSELLINVQSGHDDNKLEKNVIIITKESSPPISSSSVTNTEGQTIFRTGLYAHWWKKEQLPNQMLQGIAIDKNNNLGDEIKIVKPSYREIKHVPSNSCTKNMELSSEIHKKDNKVVRKPMKITIVKKKGSGKHSLCSNSVSLSFRVILKECHDFN
uniref:CSON011598 protein n=1 Tax=Culicoides sonorensis TaxID=179676 RepID=A0A336LGF1_CULSO